MKIVDSENAPKACGSYSQAVKSGNLIFCAGQIGIDPKSNTLVIGEIEAEAHQTFQNIAQILRSENLEMTNIIKTTVYLTDMNDWGIIDKIYSKFIPHKPARTTVSVSGLPAGAKIEIEVIAERIS